MSVLILDENHLYENIPLSDGSAGILGSKRGGIFDPVADPEAFLKNLSPKTALTLVVKPYETTYHVCPVRKAVPYLKSAEFPPPCWVGERRFPKGLTLVGGIEPSPFMLKMIALLAQNSVAVKGVFLWADLMAQAYGPLPLGWVLIWHDHFLLICHDGILRTSRPCHLSFAEELPSVFRYLKRFGYQEGMPIILIKEVPFPEALPPFVHQETRAPAHLTPNGFRITIPELVPFLHLYAWPRWIRKTACVLTALNILGAFYFGWSIHELSGTRHTTEKALSALPPNEHLDTGKMEAFAFYREVSKDRSDPLNLLRQLGTIMKGEVIATHLHWTDDPWRLTLQIEGSPSLTGLELLSAIQANLPGYDGDWQPEEGQSPRGTLTVRKRGP